jgi:hypothetical protein
MFSLEIACLWAEYNDFSATQWKKVHKMIALKVFERGRV